MPGQGAALTLAALWNELLREREPMVDALDRDETQPQMGLF